MLADTYQAQLNLLNIPTESRRALLALPIVLPFTEASLSPAEEEAVIGAARQVACLTPEDTLLVQRMCEEPLVGRSREIALGCLEELCRAEDVSDVTQDGVRMAILGCDQLIQRHTRHPLHSPEEPPSSRPSRDPTMGEWPGLAEDLVSQARYTSLADVAARFDVALPDGEPEQVLGTESYSEQRSQISSRSRRHAPIRRIRTAIRTQHEENKQGGLI